MGLCACGGLGTFQHLFNQINAPTRAVQFIAEQLVRRACGRTKTAMDTTSENRVRAVAARRAANKVGEMSLHYILRSRDGLKIGVQAARIEDALRIKRQFQTLVNGHQRRRR